MDAPQVDPAGVHVAIIGAGALGNALGRRLAQAGYDVAAVISRTEADARLLAEAVSAPVAGKAPDVLPDDVGVVFCCVPDDVVPAVAERLFLLPRDWAGSLVVHTSGVHTTEVFAPLAARGAATLSFHPLQTFAAGSPPEAFDGIYVGLQGDADAVAFGKRLAADVGATPVVLDAGAKVRYHLAASIASNFLVTLMAIAGEVFASAGIDRATGTALLHPLVDQTCRNLDGRQPEDVLTGPVARGDLQTLDRHLDALGAHLPHLVPIYAALAVETVRLAVRGGRLGPDVAQQLLDRLHAALDLHAGLGL